MGKGTEIKGAKDLGKPADLKLRTTTNETLARYKQATLIRQIMDPI